ncbi:E3 ubiquitin-protein ligase tom1 [Coemansia pectinata]|uniref:HECT-type E3 ubiquitin transferase n=1 Tax=Coemansia pectinata TaxID=1052879 RepID=A0A9W8LB73_9FUNG|nr:E3 ubiquitin-protein ligase tom1 [Coemansia pectinata]
MTRIKKLPHKRLSFPPQEIQTLREQLETTSSGNIHGVLLSYSDWPFVRGDMYHWIGVLNRFDDILANVCEEHGLSGFQTKAFDRDTQRMVVAILDFTRLLLENCINRNLYSSVERLDQLLNASDPEILEHTLRVVLRTAQRWSYQRDIKANLATISVRLTAIADPWNVKKHLPAAASTDSSEAGALVLHTNEFRMLANDEHTELLKKHADVVDYQFFRTAEEARLLEEEPATTAPPATPSVSHAQRKAQSSKRSHGTAAAVSEGLVSINARIWDVCDAAAAGGVHEQMQQAFDRLVLMHRVPASHYYELRQRIYVALALGRGDQALRLRLLRSRIYAAGVLSLMMGEQEFKNAFLSREPSFTADVIGVLQPEAHAPLSVQTTVLLVLEGLLKLRSELSGAYVALNASANHGVLMFVLRKAFAAGSNDADPPAYPYEFTSALMSFLTAMANTMNGGQLLVSAGVVPVFVAALRNSHPGHLRSAGRVAKLLDLLTSSAPPAFPAFCSTNGIATLVKRIHSEVLSAVATSDANPEAAADLSSPVALPRFPEGARQAYRRREILPAEQIYLLKELFKFLSHLVQQTGYQDRLRNLVETTLPETLRTIVTHPAAFGANVYGLAISISATLVHNEPTSLPIMQEARLPQAMLEALEEHIPYNGDVIVHIPAALGAFCLNDAGLEQVRQSTVIRKALATFSDPDFVRVLQEGDVPGLFGSVLDEFMRHFPAVKDDVMDETIEMLRRVSLMGAAVSPLRQLDPGNTYLLRAPLPSHIIGAEVATDDKGAVPMPHHDDYYGMMMESATTFLEGMLEQRTHSALFMDKGGWDVVVQAVRSPLLPFEFAKTRTFKSMHGLSTLLLETSQERVFAALFRELKLCLERPLAFSPVDGQSVGDMVRSYVALANPSGLSQDKYDAVHSRLHSTVTATGIISLITTLINGSGGGSLARSVKELTDVMAMDDFVGVLRSMTNTYKASIQAAVAVEAETARLQPPSKAGDAQAEDRKGKGREMDVDGSPATISVEPYVRTNLQNLAETAVSFTMEVGEYIECMSNSLGLTTKAKDEAGTVTKVGPALAATLVDFVLGMLALCRGVERVEAGAQLVDQAMVIVMKTLVFARHRIYLKLRILVPFVEAGGLKLFCEVLESMWTWTASLPPASVPATDAAPAVDPNARLRKVLENVLESMLSILSFVLDGEPVAECPEFLALCQEHEAERAWFRPGDFISALRFQAMPTLQLVWVSPLLVSGGNAQVMGSFIGCLGPVLSAHHEAASSKQATSAAAARAGDAAGASVRERLTRHYQELLDRRRALLGGVDGGRAAGVHTPIPALSRRLFAPTSEAGDALSLPTWPSLLGSPLGSDVPTASTPPVVPNSAHVDELMALGFAREQAEAALIRNLNSLARAANDLLSVGPEAVAPPAPVPEAEAEAEAEAEPSQDAEPMAVDTTTTAELSAASSSGSGDESSAQQGSDANAAPATATPDAQPSGVEPFNQPTWRKAKELEEEAHRIQLGALREALRASIAPQSIVIIDEIGEKAVIPIKGILELVVRKSESGPVVSLLLSALIGLLEAAATLAVGDKDEARIEERLYAHAYLWAVLLSSVPQMDEMYPLVRPLGAPLIRALDVAAASRAQGGRAPKWLTTVLLVAELLLQRDAEPPKAKLDPKEEWHRAARRGLTKLPPSAAPVDESVAPPAPSTSEADRVSQLFAEAMGVPESSAFEPILSHDEGEDSEDDEADEDVAASGAGDNASGEGSRSKPPTSEPVFGADDKLELQRMATAFFAGPNVAQYAPAELNALLRLIVILTRCPTFAVEFLDSGSLASVVRALRSVAPCDMPSISAPGAGAKEKTALGFVNALMSVPKEQQTELRQERTLIMHVLRHVVESKPVLKLQLENLIREWYRSPQFSASDIHSYVNSTLVYALRDPELFTQVSVDRNYLPSFNDEMRIHWMVLAWRSRPLLDEEEVDRFEAAPTEEVADTTASAGEGTNEAVPTAAAKPEDNKGGESFVEYLAKKEKQPAFEPYELDAESERLACRVAEFVVEEILALRPACSASAPPPVARAATTISGIANDAQQQMPPATPISKLRTSVSYAGLVTPASTSMAAAASVPEDSPDTIAYRCYLMQALSELVSSFPFVLQALFVARTVAPAGLLSPRKANKGKATATAAEEQALPQQQSLRIRSPLISHLVHDLIVREAVTNVNAPKVHGKAEEAASAATAAAAAAGGGELEQVLAIARHQITIKRGQLSRAVTAWATALLCTLCVRHQEGWTTTSGDDLEGSKVDSDNEITLDSLVGSYGTALYAARHLTLDHIVRAFRECLAATSGSALHGNDVTYARLTSLARLTYKLVTARPISPGRITAVASGDQQEKESPNTLKKMLLERGILDLLTAASSRLNLNHPQGREMLNLFLRPMEHLAKAAVRISREAVLQTWEESGQDKMPSSAMSSGTRGGFNMDLLEDENALVAEDEDVPPDLYENSALGLYQNQRTAAGHDGGDLFNEDDLMEEDFEEELYDDDNSSVSDIDTDDEDMDENMLLDENIADGAEAGDGMDMDGSVGGIGRNRGGADDDDDEDDDLSDSDSGSISGDDDSDNGDDDLDDDEDDDGEGLDTDLELDLELSGRRGQSAADFLAFEEDRMMDAEEREADFYGSDLDGEVVQSEDGRLGDEDGADQEGGWESDLSDADLGMLEAIHHTLTHHAHRHHHHGHGHMHARIAGRSSRPASGDGNAAVMAATVAALGAGGEGADDDVDDDDNEGGGSTSEDESHSESGDDQDMFPVGFPDTLEITMEAIDDAGNGGGRATGAMERVSGLSELLMETMAAGLAIGRGGGGAAHRLNGLPGLGRLGTLNGMSGISIGRGPGAANPLLVRRQGPGDMIDFAMPRMPGLGGGMSRLGGGAHGLSMLHPLVDRSERSERGGDRSASGLQQARAERVSRSSLSGPLRTTPDDVFGLGQALATQLSHFHSGGRRPAYTHHLIPGASSQREPRAWLEDSDSQSVTHPGVEYGSSAGAHEVLELLVRMCYAAIAIEGFVTLGTAERWQEEARMQPRAPASAYTTRIGAPILNRLAPEAIRQNLLRQRYQVERVGRTAEIERRRIEREDAERREREAEAEAERARAEAEAERVRAEQGEDMALDEAEDKESDGSSSEEEEEEEAQPAEPVFVVIDGERIDITDTGIDPEFLLALPDDLRMEVIEGRREQQRVEQRQTAGAASTSGADAQAGAGAATDGGISQEFLDALPPEIREEVLEQERLQRQLLDRDDIMNRLDRGASGGAVSSGATAAANATPQATTLESMVRDRMRIGMPGPSNRWGMQMQPSVAALGGSGGGENAAELQRLREKRRKRIAARDVSVQLLSRAELAALTRFIFLPNHALSGPLVNKIMLFVCENGRARSQFIQLMLAILDSNATTLEDVDAVIRLAIAASSSSSATTAADPSLPTEQTPLQSQMSSLGGAEHAFALGDLHTTVPAYVPAQRSLEVLHALAAHNPRASMHFLVEHHHHHQHALKPLHGKARADNDDESSRFPVVHLLRLLEKPLYYSQGNTVTELLMQLLSTITKPLGGMVRRNLQHLQYQEPTITEMVPAEAAEGSGPSAPAAATLSTTVQLPGIPGHALRAIVNVLAAGECTSRTFQHTLSLIQNLSHMTGVLSVITDELVRRASELSDSVCEEIEQLLGVLKDVVPASQVETQTATGGGEEVAAAAELSAEKMDRVRDITLGKFSPASSHQSRLLRLLMAIDYISTTVTKRLEDRRKAAVAEKKPAVEAGKQEESESMDVDSGTAAASTAAVDEDLAQELMRLRSLSLSNDTHFVPLWEATSQCLRCASASVELAHVATVLLPLIESFMVVYKPVLAEKSRMTDSSVGGGSSSAQISPMSVSPSAGEAYFQNFTERHKKILNTLVRNNPGLLSGSFSLLVFNPHVLDFDNKRSYFYQRLHDDSANANSNNRRALLLGQGGAGGTGAGGLGQPSLVAGQPPSATHAHHHPTQRPLGQTLHLNVRRETVFEDSYHQFAGQSGEEIKRGRIHVKFRDEEGVDAGGVSREWFQALARQMFNPDYALFKPSAAGRVTYQPNPQSWVNPDHLQYFKFVGRIIGKAIVDQRVLDAYFTRSFYKHILGRKVDYRDMEAIDPSYYKSLEWILENDITELLEETFSIEVDDFGQHRVVDLIPNGHEVNVTEENKAEYVRLVTLQRLYLAIKDQIKSFLTGFHDLIPRDLIQIFNEQELELLISGMPDIDVDDWRNNTEYHGGFNSGSAQIQWFWRAVRSFDQEERAKLLQFVTGTSKVPLEGFAHLQGNQGVQKFQIHKDFGSPTRLPTAHTCFNQLDLPLCESFEILRANLLLAISECSTGFGFV